MQSRTRREKYVAPDGGEGIPQAQVEVLYAEYKASGTSRARREAIRNQLVMAYQPFVANLCKPISRQGYHSQDDLVQEATLALLKAFGNYDPARGSFASFVGWQVKCALMHYTSKNQAAVNLPDSKPVRRAVYAIMRELKAGSLTSKNIHTIAGQVGCSDQFVRDVLVAMRPARSMHSPVAGHGDLTLQESFVSDDELPEDALEMAQVEQMTACALRQALRQLTPRELNIVQRRRLAEKGKETLADIGREHDVSAERIRQVEANALRKMRKVMEPAMA